MDINKIIEKMREKDEEIFKPLGYHKEYRYGYRQCLADLVCSIEKEEQTLSYTGLSIKWKIPADSVTKFMSALKDSFDTVKELDESLR